MQKDVYSASLVTPFRSPVLTTIKSLEIDQAINFPNERRNSVMSAITRLHKQTTFKYKTTKVSEDEFAVIRLQ